MGSWRNVTLVAVAVMLAAVGLGVFRYFAGDPNTPSYIFGCVAFAAPFFAGGLLAVVGDRRGHPLFVVAAGVGLYPISLVSIVMWPLLIPAALLIWQGGRRIDDPTAAEALVSVAIVAGLCGTFAMLVFHKDPATWQAPDGSSGSSDIITSTESLITLSILAAVFVAAFLVPARDHHRQADTNVPPGLDLASP